MALDLCRHDLDNEIDMNTILFTLTAILFLSSPSLKAIQPSTKNNPSYADWIEPKDASVSNSISSEQPGKIKVLESLRTDCKENQNCEHFLKALLILEKYEEALPLSQKNCDEKNQCRLLIELENELFGEFKSFSKIQSKCDSFLKTQVTKALNSSNDSCETLGLILLKKNQKKQSLKPLEFSCHFQKNIEACRALSFVYWNLNQKEKSIHGFTQLCENKEDSSCDWKNLLSDYLQNKISIQSAKKKCAADDLKSCYEYGQLKRISNRNPDEGLLILKKLCSEKNDSRSCWTLFMEDQILYPATSFKKDLEKLCSDKIVPACNNLNELKLRLGEIKIK